MSTHRPTGRTIWRFWMPLRSGGRRKMSTGTRHRGTAHAMVRMIDDLGPRGQRAWDLLDAVASGTITIGDLYDAYRDNALDRLRAQLADVNLAEHIGAWDRYLEDRVGDETRVRYRQVVESFRPAKGPWMASTVDTAACERWLSTITGGAGTKRKKFFGLNSFFEYATTVGVLRANPLTPLSPPPAPDPEIEFYELDEVRRLVEATTEPHQSLLALMYGTGIEVSVAIGLTRRDVNLTTWEIRARGTKTHNRDRIALVSEWARPYVEAACKGKLPDAPLFPGVSRWTISDVHRATAKRLKLRLIKLHAARDHWAVRMIRAGTPIEMVARQLGHKDAVMALKVYGRFVPTSHERREWDRIASEKEQRQGRGL